MKIGHLNGELTGDLTIRELQDSARALEAEGENDKSIKIYRAIIKKKPLNAMAFNRLMILYRKLKHHTKEIAVIDQAIASFESGAEINKEPNGRIGKLSLSIGKLTGLIDKKGKSLYAPEPVASWKKRKLLAQKRLKTQKK